MMAARRLSRAHHEFRFGRRELAVLGAVFCLIASLVFVAGVVVGREMSRSKARAEAPRESRLAEADGHRGGDTVKTAARQAEEKVTFYRTLTAPTQDLPKVGKPTVEERMVPKDEPVTTPAADAVRCRRARGAARRRARSVADRAGGAPRRPRAQDAEGAGAGRNPSPTARHAPGPRRGAPAGPSARPGRRGVRHGRARDVDRAGERLPEPGSGRGAPRAAGGAGVRRLRLSLAHRGRPTAPRSGRSVSGAEDAARRHGLERAGLNPW
jgi:hypothetical protein